MTITSQKYANVPLLEELKEKWISDDEKYTDSEEKGDLVMSYLKFS